MQLCGNIGKSLGAILQIFDFKQWYFLTGSHPNAERLSFVHRKTALGHSRRFWYDRSMSGYGVASEMPIVRRWIASLALAMTEPGFARSLPD
jgi:hypothetical protein